MQLKLARVFSVSARVEDLLGMHALIKPFTHVSWLGQTTYLIAAVHMYQCVGCAFGRGTEDPNHAFSDNEN